MDDLAPRLRVQAQSSTEMHPAGAGDPRRGLAIHAGDKLQFLAELARDRRLNATDLRCCIAIVNLFNAKKGRAWPSYSRLCADTGCSRAGIAKSIQKLNELGLIAKDRGGKGRSNSYHPAFATPVRSGVAEVPQVTQSPSACLPKRTIVPRARPQQSSRLDQGGQRGETLYDTYPSEDTEKDMCRGAARGGAPLGSAPAAAARRPVGETPLGFDDFFAIYPKREGRVAAMSASAAALRDGDVTAEVLQERAKAYAAAKQHLDPQYIKMPANWLKDRCWLEDPRPPTARRREGASPSPAPTKQACAPIESRRRPKMRGYDERRAAYDAEEKLEDIRALAAQGKLPSLGKAKARGWQGYGIEYYDILRAPNWRRLVVVRPVAATDIGSMTKKGAVNFERTMDDVVNDEMTGTILPALALEERRGLAVLRGWSAEQVEHEHAEARRRYERGCTPAR